MGVGAVLTQPLTDTVAKQVKRLIDNSQNSMICLGWKYVDWIFIVIFRGESKFLFL